MKKLLLGFVLLNLASAFVHSEEIWDFRLTPYLWFAGFKGNVSTIPGASEALIEISANDALNDIETCFMMMFEAKKQRHGLLADVLYSDTQSQEVAIPLINLNLQSISKNMVFSAAYLYELQDHENTVVDVFAGVRYWKVDTELKFSDGLGFLANQKIRSSDSWTDPMIGIKGRTVLGDSRFYLASGLALGGFGVGSDSFYDLSGNLVYQWNSAIGTSLGYRIYDLDYEDGSFVYDVKQQGWALTLSQRQIRGVQNVCTAHQPFTHSVAG